MPVQKPNWTTGAWHHEPLLPGPLEDPVPMNPGYWPRSDHRTEKIPIGGFP